MTEGGVSGGATRPEPARPRALLVRDAPQAPFKLEAPYAPTGDQPRAIAELTEGLRRG